jgi:uncharacterized membrane protein (DUF106 family)
MDKEGSYKGIFIVMIITLAIAGFWDSFSAIKDTAHAILDPSLGILLNWNLSVGMMIAVFLISVFMTFVQKYATDQETLKEMKKEQKALQEEMKKFKEHPEKLAELQKKQFEFLPRMFKLNMRSMVYTGIPVILLFRWFSDFFISIDNAKILGMHWLVFYILASIIFSTILRKIFDVH